MTDPTRPVDAAPLPARTALREARASRGWSQSGAAAALRELAERRGGPDASAASLKTQLSRWENGHSRPEPEYRALLAELYGRTAAQLGLVPAPDGPDSRERLRAEFAGAAAVGDAVLEQWGAQLTAAHRVDDELGAAGAAGVTEALVDQLTRTLRHTPAPPGRRAIAGLLAGAAVLAGRQRLDAEDPDGAWRHLDTAAAAAAETGSGALTLDVLVGRAELLCEIGRAEQAVALVDDPGWEDLPGIHLARLAAARGVAHATAGDAAAARLSLAEASRAMPTTSAPARSVPARSTPARSTPARSTPARSTPSPTASTVDEPAVDVAHPGGLAFELADLHRWHGRALVELGDPSATHPLESALAAGPRSVRVRAELHADLARATQLDDAIAAAGHAHRARELAERIGSRRLVTRLDATNLPGGGRR